MTQQSFYGVLLVDQSATLDEIKLAFKRRALQVHPDKGGSKEEFHLVYQALETLANPEARKRYDQRCDASLKPHPSAKTSSKPCQKMPGARAGTRKSHMPQEKFWDSSLLCNQTNHSRPSIKANQAFKKNQGSIETIVSRSTEWNHCQAVLPNAAFDSWEVDGGKLWANWCSRITAGLCSWRKCMQNLPCAYNNYGPR